MAGRATGRSSRAAAVGGSATSCQLRVVGGDVRTPSSAVTRAWKLGRPGMASRRATSAAWVTAKTNSPSGPDETPTDWTPGEAAEMALEAGDAGDADEADRRRPGSLVSARRSPCRPCRGRGRRVARRARRRRSSGSPRRLDSSSVDGGGLGLGGREVRASGRARRGADRRVVDRRSRRDVGRRPRAAARRRPRALDPARRSGLGSLPSVAASGLAVDLPSGPRRADSAAARSIDRLGGDGLRVGLVDWASARLGLGDRLSAERSRPRRASVSAGSAARPRRGVVDLAAIGRVLDARRTRPGDRQSSNDGGSGRFSAIVGEVGRIVLGEQALEERGHLVLERGDAGLDQLDARARSIAACSSISVSSRPCAR